MVTHSTRERAGSAADRNSDMYSRAMQWDIFSEEERPLLWSHMVSFGLAITFMLLVVFGPRPVVIPQPVVDSGAPMRVDMDGLVPESKVAASRWETGGTTGSAGAARTASAAISRGHESGIAAAFRRSGLNPGGMVGASGVLRGVETGGSGGYSGLASVGSAGQGGRAALSYGDGSGSTGSGRAGIGDGSGAGSGGIGGVAGGTGSVVRSAVTVSAPRVVAEELSGPRRDVSQLGSIVRDRQAVLQSCYTQQGLAVNPTLAGTLDVAITLNSAGSVARVAATPRSMSGAGTSQVVSCIETKISGWKFPPSDAGSGTYSFPFSFTS